MQVHGRKAWQRPKSDYGSRFWRSGGSDKHRGKSGETGGLETLVEHEGSTLGSGEGDGDRSRGKTSRGQGEDDLSKVR